MKHSPLNIPAILLATVVTSFGVTPTPTPVKPSQLPVVTTLGATDKFIINAAQPAGTPVTSTVSWANLKIALDYQPQDDSLDALSGATVSVTGLNLLAMNEPPSVNSYLKIGATGGNPILFTPAQTVADLVTAGAVDLTATQSLTSKKYNGVSLVAGTASGPTATPADTQATSDSYPLRLVKVGGYTGGLMDFRFSGSTNATFPSGTYTIAKVSDLTDTLTAVKSLTFDDELPVARQWITLNNTTTHDLTAGTITAMGIDLHAGGGNASGGGSRNHAVGLRAHVLLDADSNQSIYSGGDGIYAWSDSNNYAASVQRGLVAETTADGATTLGIGGLFLIDENGTGSYAKAVGVKSDILAGNPITSNVAGVVNNPTLFEGIIHKNGTNGSFTGTATGLNLDSWDCTTGLCPTSSTAIHIGATTNLGGNTTNYAIKSESIAQSLFDGNITARSLNPSYTTTATSAGTTTLDKASTQLQYFTGTTTHTVVMPDVTLLTLGQSFRIVNDSTGIVTVKSSGNGGGGDTILAMSPKTQMQADCILLTGTTNASWKQSETVQNITRMSNLTTNGVVTVVGNTGVLSSVAVNTGADLAAAADTGNGSIYSALAYKTYVDTVAPPTDVQAFTSSGTWTKPTGAKYVEITAVGGGGGGGSGRKGAAGSARGGGGGGGGGGFTRWRANATLLGATETVTVSSAATGGIAVASDDTDGNLGSAGAASTFGTFVRAGGGAGGIAGTTASATNATGGTGEIGGSLGGAASVTIASGAGSAMASFAATGGGAGGGIDTGNAALDAGNGGARGVSVLPTVIAGGVGATTTTANGGAGVANVTGDAGGGSGGGGGKYQAAGAGAGGAGAIYGGGGGGGAAGINAVNSSGTGGVGGTGIIIVTTYR